MFLGLFIVGCKEEFPQKTAQESQVVFHYDKQVVESCGCSGGELNCVLTNTNNFDIRVRAVKINSSEITLWVKELKSYNDSHKFKLGTNGTYGFHIYDMNGIEIDYLFIDTIRPSLKK